MACCKRCYRVNYSIINRLECRRQFGDSETDGEPEQSLVRRGCGWGQEDCLNGLGSGIGALHITAPSCTFQDIFITMSNDEIKADVTYSENKHDIANVKADLDEGLRKSPFDTLSLGTTLWIFRRTVLYAFMAFTLALLDAWQVSLDLLVALIDVRSPFLVLSSRTEGSSSNLAIHPRPAWRH